LNLTVAIGLFLSLIVSNVSIAQYENIAQEYTGDFYTHSVDVDGVKFLVHYPGQKKKLKDKIVKIIKTEFSFFHKYFDYRPQSDVHFVVLNGANEANGSARVFPYNIVVLNDYPPLNASYLNSTSDWIKQLVVHEYIHILTMDMTSGWVDSIRSVFGSMVKTNAVIPRWLAEGVAVWAESLVPNNGRANDANVLYEVYTQLKNEDNCQNISCLDNPRLYPYGHMRYWTGGYFSKYLEETKPNTMACIFKDHSDGIPFLLNDIFSRCYGKTVSQAFKSFRQDYLRQYSYLEDYCPVSNKNVCLRLKEKKLLKFVYWQKGTCTNKVVISEASSSSVLSASHRIYDVTTGTEIKTKFPIRQLMEVNNKCLVNLTQNTGLMGAEEYYILANGKLVKQLALQNSEKVLSEGEILHPINYVEGRWKLTKMDHQYLIGDEIQISEAKLNADKVSYLDNNKEQQEKTLTPWSTEVDAPDDETYVPYRYFAPTYFYFLLSNIGNLNQTNFLTSLSDPLDRHIINVQYDYYENPDVPSGSGSSVNYNYRRNNDRWGFGYSKSYGLSLFNENVNSSEFYFLSYQRLLPDADYNQNVGGSVSKLLTNDFISKRKTFSVDVSHSISYSTNEIEAFTRTMMLRTRLLKSQVEGKKEFYGVRLGYLSGHYFTERFSFSPEINYGKFFKDDLTRGYLSGGGFTSFFTGNVSYPFYSVNQGDIFGNELLTARFNFDYRMSEPYSGKDTWPAFLRHINFRFGIEYAKSRFIAVGDQLYIDDNALAYFYGASFNTVFFYGVPVNYHLLVTQLERPQKSTGIILFFTAQLF
jgi:hypothetical protein